jgi:transcriptional regulator with XRE-family HTH domain
MQTLPIGGKLRDWRHRRRLSQLDLALDAGISARHLSFIETGRSTPSRDMVLRLADCLELPLRERNACLLAAGFAPAFPDPDLADVALQPALAGVRALLKAHEPFAALAVDRHWNLIAANGPTELLLADAAPWLKKPPINVLRASLHPEGLAPRIRNYSEWRAHLVHRLRRQFADSADPEIGTLIEEISAYPVPTGAARPSRDPGETLAVPLVLDTPRGLMRFVSTTMVFGAPHAPVLAELAIETFLPADEATMQAVRGL